MTTDAELLRRYAEEKSEAAFAEVVQRYVDLVYSAALRQVRGDTHHAQDVAQVVFTTLARKAACLTKHPVLAGWLYTATQHAAAKVIRTEARRRTREQESHLMQEIIGSDQSAIDWERVRPVLDAAMGELSMYDRDAVLLRFFAQRSFAEIGFALEVGEDAARMRVSRALEKLHVLLARRGVTSTSAALGAALSSHSVMAAPAGLAAQATGSAMLAGSASFDAILFMSTTKFTATAATLVVLLATSIALYEVRQQRTAREALAAAERTQAEQRARLRAAEERSRVAEQELASVRQSIESARAAAASSSRAAANALAPASTKPSSDPVADGVAFLARFPNVKQALLDRSYARIRARFESLYPALQLTPDQIRQFEEILLDGEGLTTSYPDLSILNLRPGAGRTRAEMDQAIQELLGGEGYRRYREHMNESGPLQFTTQLASSLYFTADPLTAQQARELGLVLTRNNVENRGESSNRKWETLLAAARPILSDTQYAALGRLQAQEEFGVAMKTLTMK